MPDGFTIDVDASGVIAMFDRIAASGDYVCKSVGRETAKRIVAEAQARERRAVSGTATGITESGIHWELTRDGKGYVVLGYQAGVQAPVDYYLQHGTKYMYAKPFFFSAAELESGPHLRRLAEALQKFLDDVGR